MLPLRKNSAVYQCDYWERNPPGCDWIRRSESAGCRKGNPYSERTGHRGYRGGTERRMWCRKSGIFPLYPDKNTLCHHEICTDTWRKDCLLYRGFQMGNGRRGKGICPAHEKQAYGDYGWSWYGSGGWSDVKLPSGWGQKSGADYLWFHA